MSKLKEMREKKGLSQQDVADATGLSVRSIQHYEQGTLSLDSTRIDKIFALALVLDCDVEDILTDPKTIRLIREYQEC